MEVERTSISQTYFRHIPAGGDIRYQADPPADSRWQRGDVIDALYFADSEATAWAEWYRSIAEIGVPPTHALPRDMWEWEISLPSVADLSTEDRLSEVGLSAPRPTQREWPAFQAVGETLHEEGWPALLGPSAARPSTLILCVFREDAIPPGTRPLPPPTTHDEPPPVPRGLTT